MSNHRSDKNNTEDSDDDQRNDDKKTGASNILEDYCISYADEEDKEHVIVDWSEDEHDLLFGLEALNLFEPESILEENEEDLMLDEKEEGQDLKEDKKNKGEEPVEDGNNIKNEKDEGVEKGSAKSQGHEDEVTSQPSNKKQRLTFSPTN